MHSIVASRSFLQHSTGDLKGFFFSLREQLTPNQIIYITATHNQVTDEIICMDANNIPQSDWVKIRSDELATWKRQSQTMQTVFEGQKN